MQGSIPDREGLAYRLHDNRLAVLDQSRLPTTEEWIAVDDADTLIEAIQSLRVRGAPLIGVVAALLVAVRAHRGDDHDAVAAAIDRIGAARPTAVNLMHAMDTLRRSLAQTPWRDRVIAAAIDLCDADVRLCETLADRGAGLIGPGERLLTHCNTGGLATAGIGTALGVIRRAHEQNKTISVWVDETRPLLQGARLTAWELGVLGVPYRLIIDSAAATLMATGEVDRVIVGADRIAANGDVANKIGTYALAVLAQFHGVSFAVAAPHTTLDADCAAGAAIPIEQRAAAEVRGVAGAAGDTCWAPPAAPIANPAFDVTPATLIDDWILDTGVFTAADIRAGAFAPGGPGFVSAD